MSSNITKSLFEWGWVKVKRNTWSKKINNIEFFITTSSKSSTIFGKDEIKAHLFISNITQNTIEKLYEYNSQQVDFKAKDFKVSGNEIVFHSIARMNAKFWSEINKFFTGISELLLSCGVKVNFEEETTKVAEDKVPLQKETIFDTTILETSDINEASNIASQKVEEQTNTNNEYTTAENTINDKYKTSPFDSIELSQALLKANLENNINSNNGYTTRLDTETVQKLSTIKSKRSPIKDRKKVDTIDFSKPPEDSFDELSVNKIGHTERLDIGEVKNKTMIPKEKVQKKKFKKLIIYNILLSLVYGIIFSFVGINFLFPLIFAIYTPIFNMIIYPSIYNYDNKLHIRLSLISFFNMVLTYVFYVISFAIYQTLTTSIYKGNFLNYIIDSFTTKNVSSVYIQSLIMFVVFGLISAAFSNIIAFIWGKLKSK